MVLDISTSDEPEADDDWFPKCSHDCNHISGWDETEFHGSIGEEDRKTPIIICTKWGRRSAKAKQVLTKLGFNGGILCAGGIATLKPLLEAEKKGGLDRKPAAKDDEEGEKEETQEDATDNEEDASEGGGAKLEGMVFAITGTLSMKRAEFETLLKEHGGVLKGSVTKDVTHLISARDDTAKAKKAKANGVEILKEEAVLSMIGK
ncbi:DNA ligase [Seminavis robusta]|uniref:DNA ligase n=1 Tax=Seminavis robusta TaxID=568900 RepID=A0A9N8DCC6_9STRA|nr:DNA ligase [Seminavis robusta]|eukprot:Sro75_g041210.1 DNA ligase (205) ;mRNA; r:60161-60847